MVRGVLAKATGTSASSGVPIIVVGATPSGTDQQATEVPSLENPPATLA
jgi:hypothetical protein